MYRYLLFVVAAFAVSWLGRAESATAEDLQDGKRDATVKAPVSRSDALSDPLLMLLRAPRIHRELALKEEQIRSLDEMVSEIDEPLWRLRDLQFANADSSQKAWQLVGQAESKLGGIFSREQYARFRQLTVQARGYDALLSSDVIQGLGLSSEQIRQITEILDETRKEAGRLKKESAGRDEAGDSRQAEQVLAGQRKKAVAVLTDAQKRQFQKLLGNPFDFGKIPRRYARAPEIRGVDDWINTAPLTLAKLRGKVVVVHFFTFGCINCIHNQPAYKDWHDRFSRQGVVVLGIHTPETAGEKNLQNVRDELRKQGIKYPVAVDNKKENWTAWANNMWPSVYLIDKEGYVRYWWYGELNWQGAGGEKLFRTRIAELLAEESGLKRDASAKHGSAVLE
jgi:peroxiredoxin/uncharacterized protein (DUF1778 family)